MSEVMSREAMRAAVEAVIFASAHPITIKKIAEVLEIPIEVAKDLVEELKRLYEAEGRGIQIVEVAGGYEMATRPEYGPYVEKLERPGKGAPLSRAALETLAIIAYKQPVTRSEIEDLRGVSVDWTLSTLMERGLVREVGRKEAPGRPILYGTTPEFLRYFGIKSLKDLPPLPEGSGAPPEAPGSLGTGEGQLSLAP